MTGILLDILLKGDRLHSDKHLDIGDGGCGPPPGLWPAVDALPAHQLQHERRIGAHPPHLRPGHGELLSAVAEVGAAARSLVDRRAGFSVPFVLHVADTPVADRGSGIGTSQQAAEAVRAMPQPMKGRMRTLLTASKACSQLMFSFHMRNAITTAAAEDRPSLQWMSTPPAGAQQLG